LKIKTKKISVAAATATLIPTAVNRCSQRLLNNLYALCELEEDEKMSPGELFIGVSVTLGAFLAFLALTSFIILHGSAYK
jgi:hypothetical protein